jgi:hypothetical protein
MNSPRSLSFYLVLKVLVLYGIDVYTPLGGERGSLQNEPGQNDEEPQHKK